MAGAHPAAMRLEWLGIDVRKSPLYTQTDRQVEPANGGQNSRPVMPAGRDPRRFRAPAPWPGAKHPLLIRGQDQSFGAGHIVRLGADVPRAIEEQHPQQLAGGNRFAEAVGYEQMHRDDADRAGADQGSGGHG